MQRILERFDSLAGIEDERGITRFLDRIAFAFLILMVISAPHSIAATQISWLTGMLAYVIRVCITRRRTGVSVLYIALWTLLGWSALTAVVSFAPDISLDKLKAVLLFLIVFFVAGNVRKLRVGYFLAFMLILSCMVNVIMTPIQRILGRGVEVHGVHEASALPGQNIMDGDTLLTVNKRKIASPDDIIAAIEQTGSAEIVVYKTDYEIKAFLKPDDLLAGSNANERLGFESWKRSHNWRSAGFYGHYATYAEVLQLIMSLVLGLLIALFGRNFTSGTHRHAEAKQSILELRQRVTESPRLFYLLIFTIAAMCLALLLTVTRASQLAFVISGLFMILVGLGRKWLLISLVIVVPLALAGLFALQQTRQVGFFDQNDNSITWRETVWREGFDLWTDNPHNFIVGVGMDSIKRFAPEWHLFDDGRLPMGHFHSTPLQLAVERGLPALLIWLTILGIYTRTLWRGIRANKGGDWRLTGVMLGSLGGAIGFFTSGLVHYNLGDSEVAMVFYMLMGLSVKMVELSAAEPRTKPQINTLGENE
ncbi:MAG: O-antigen ligase family protein [Pyrinomonadaceae bacterium]